MTIGIMAAMEEEIKGILSVISDPCVECWGMRDYYSGTIGGKKIVAVLSRIGKVAAATTVTTLINRYDIESLIFTGVAGGTNPVLKVGDIVIGEKLIQHDMDASPIVSRYEIPLLGRTYFQTDRLLTDRLMQATELFIEHDLETFVGAHHLQEFSLNNIKHHSGVIASGDKFFSSKKELLELKGRISDMSCVEMEGAAVAQVCYEHKIPFGIVRTISDHADDDSPVDFMNFIQHIAARYSLGIIERFLAGN